MGRLNILIEKFNQNKNLYISVGSVMIVTFVVKIFGFLKEMFIGEAFGMSDELDIFFIIILIPAFFNNVFVGAFKSVIIPNYIFAEKKANETFKNNIIIQTLVLGLILIVIVSLCLTPINNYLTRNYNAELANLVKENQYLVVICIPFWTLTGLLSGLLDIKKRFTVSAIYPIITSLVFLILLKILPPSFDLLVYAFIVGSVFEFCFVLCFERIKIDFNKINLLDEDSLLLYNQFLPKLLAGLIIGLNPIVDQIFSSDLADGAISTLNYGNKLPAFAITVLSVGVGNVILPFFARLESESNSKIYSIVKKKIILFFIIGLLFTLALILFGKEIIQLFFERGQFTTTDTTNVYWVLVMFSLQIPFYVIDIVLVRFLTAFNLNYFNILSSTISVALNIICNFLFIDRFGISGIALSTSVVVVISFLVKFTYVNKKFNNEKRTRI